MSNKPSKDVILKDLHDLYKILGLPLDSTEITSGFTVNYLQDIFKELPNTSAPFRPNYFSFLFIKNAFER